MNLHQRNDTLSECDREAIHHIAAVQNFGGLIAADPQGRVVQASANIADLLGLADPLPPAPRWPPSSRLTRWQPSIRPSPVSPGSTLSNAASGLI